MFKKNKNMRGIIMSYVKCMFLLYAAGFLPLITIQAQTNTVTIDWNKIIMISKTTPTLQ